MISLNGLRIAGLRCVKTCGDTDIEMSRETSIGLNVLSSLLKKKKKKE